MKKKKKSKKKSIKINKPNKPDKDIKDKYDIFDDEEAMTAWVNTCTDIIAKSRPGKGSDDDNNNNVIDADEDPKKP